MKLFIDQEGKAPSHICLGCGRTNDRHSGVEQGNAPEPGNVGVCIACATVFVFEDDLSVRTITSDELAQRPLEMQTQIATVVAAIRVRRQNAFKRN